MQRQLVRMALTIALVSPLGGCQFINSLHLSHRSASPQPALARDQYYTGKGQDLLRSGQPGGAAEAFNLALATGEDPAPAYNGLGVAFARMGRPDLAYRFFNKAVTSDPGNLAYAGNLDRLVKSPEFTLDMVPASQATAPSATPDVSGSPPSRVAGASNDDHPAGDPQGRLRRTGPGQVSLTTLPPGTAPFGANPGTPTCSHKRLSRQSICKVRTAQRHKPTPETGSQTATVAAASEQGASAPDKASKRKVLDLRAMPGIEQRAGSTETPASKPSGQS